MSALPDAVRVELEEIQSGGGLGHLQEVSQQIRVGSDCAWVGGCFWASAAKCVAADPGGFELRLGGVVDEAECCTASLPIQTVSKGL